MPIVREMYEDLLPLVQKADVLIASELIYPAAAIGDKLGIRWLSLITEPASFFSTYDPPVLPPAPFLHGLRHLGPWTNLALNVLFRFKRRVGPGPSGVCDANSDCLAVKIRLAEKRDSDRIYFL